jgi:hypothetical protein
MPFLFRATTLLLPLDAFALSDQRLQAFARTDQSLMRLSLTSLVCHEPKDPIDKLDRGRVTLQGSQPLAQLPTTDYPCELRATPEMCESLSCTEFRAVVDCCESSGALGLCRWFDGSVSC